MNYYQGNFKEDAMGKQGYAPGWLFGYFAKDTRRTDDVEVKFVHFEKGEAVVHETKYQKTAIESSFIIKGSATGEIDGKLVTLQKGDYVVIPPGVVSNYPKEILEDFESICIKAPSVPDDKVIVETP